MGARWFFKEHSNFNPTLIRFSETIKIDQYIGILSCATPLKSPDLV